MSCDIEQVSQRPRIVWLVSCYVEAQLGEDQHHAPSELAGLRVWRERKREEQREGKKSFLLAFTYSTKNRGKWHAIQALKAT